MVKAIERTCNLCKQRVGGNEEHWKQHGADNHPNHFLQGFAVKCPDPKFSEKNYWCPLDNKWYESRKYLARTIKEKGWTNAQYYTQYGKEFMAGEWVENETHTQLGNAHNTDTCLQCNDSTPFQEGKWTFPAFCGSSCGTKWYAVNSDRIEVAMTTLRERKAVDPNHHLRPNQKRYWTNQGFSEEEAIGFVKIRNAVNSLENYIKRAGGNVEEGTRKWADRQAKWLESLKRSGKYQGYSKMACSLFDQLVTTNPTIQYGKDELGINSGYQVFNVDCIEKGKNRIIEFNGNYWHANPSIYTAEHKIIDKTAQELWNRDAARLQILKSMGYQVLIVWESEYKEDTQGVIERCIDFLNKD